ncbi:aminotransferase class IV [Flavobacteriaceae bacterium S0862]|nr:aminotransferase class IV [Flavobacteriaceae bacterium S0862]
MVNTNGNILNEADASLPVNNRGFNYGDAVFETIKVSHSKILFWEDHYFRLMASMRILRMEIPMSFTLEFLEKEILKLVEHNNQLKESVRVKLIVFRDGEGLYTPKTSEVSFLISSKTLQNDFYELNDNEYRVDLYKDHYLSPSLLSTIKSNNRLINVIGGIYASENGLQNCLLLNTDKHVVEALNSNIFLVKEQIVKTPPLTDGCIKGVMRKQIIEIIELIPEYTIEEASISPFELQKADELFLTNIISGIQPITNYRKKQFTIDFSKNLLAKLNVTVRLT